MATYRTYPAVQKLQAYLEAHKDSIGFEKSLRGADGAFDGKYGPDTDEAFWSWLEKQPPGSDLSSLVPRVLSAAEAAQVEQAMDEFSPPLKPEPGLVDHTELPFRPPSKAGLGTGAWMAIGVGVVIAGAAIYWAATRRET